MKKLDANLQQHLWAGTVIPAHPLALHEDRSIDEESQRLLTKYYIASGAGGIAVAVHSTQFEIRDPKINLFETVLKWASEEVDNAELQRPFLKIAGICGPTEQAVQEARTALKYGYDIGLLSMGGLNDWTEKAILDRVRAVAAIIPVFGFYLQPSVGGRIFSYSFWQEFVEIENVVAIKCASFNRYQTLDVMRALANSDRSDQIAMYTGNDDNIVNDLMTTYQFPVNGKIVDIDFKGGLLGHWAVWTQKAVTLLDEIKNYKRHPDSQTASDLLSKAIAITDSNAAFFDPANAFHGCIPGLHEVLTRQGLMKGTWCINPKEQLSPGQKEEIDRVYSDYPELNDDAFVQRFLNSR
ncbi:dihydrodipicolinate synthase family protein [Sphingobacterium prati]|uniref:dihydrodipicolinate synthase family protein n=1 Tax=Sphingobacterium prati TaxID=2737006 RepID=UPI0015562B42|nr:dihydrodipicolinate synthase family protein [Sphingobacterium prati]NPE48031.1 dihydrodipicolinate synthase family protein [Sphingobacterium prati]